MIIIPAIDILEEKIVRLEKGDFEKPTFYEHNFKELAKQFVKYGIQRIHVVDLDGARKGYMSNLSLLADIKKAANCSLEIGGGIRSLKMVENIWSNGFLPEEDKIMFGSLPLYNQHEFLAITQKYSSSIVITIDVFGEEIRVSGWQKSASKNLFSYIEEICEIGISNFLITQIKNDGMLTGVDIQLYKKIIKQFPSINITVSGGLSSIQELHELKKLNVFGVILGKAFYENKITLEELKKEGFI